MYVGQMERENGWGGRLAFWGSDASSKVLSLYETVRKRGEERL